ncbi:thiamine ABC transporter substrate-binding protein [Nocardioides coralli]|uniref:thiamine ABC transporter substrate-binding protein n=1 Tax=Nocardioides coralli TaxID=2872154 RepID=UPI001CA3F186|nr:thiamine ABC transporter substrate-binding protein [Nocardioides coralli]QZY29397.1 thiamine ABC transporter substrate-binding protein [Nocardioides coralli]
MRPILPVLLAASLTAGCSLVGGSSDEAASDRPDGPTPDEVVLVTHESFSLPKPLVRQFERESGFDLEIRPAGDAGALTTKLALTSDNPTGDVAFGVDNTFASRALDEGVFADLDVDLPEGAGDFVVPADGGERMAPVDHGHVCVNVDVTWFEERGLTPPTSLDDLTDPAYEGLFVTPSALSSSPGLAFLMTTVAAYGEAWPDYWRELLGNGTKVVDGWSDAYYTDFTQGGGDGSRPVVLSYDSSPAFTVPKGTDTSTTRALLDTCFRQVEYAGVLAGADNPEGGRALVEFLLGEDVQAALPESMYVFPVRDGVDLPPAWAEHAEQPEDPFTLDPAEIAAEREGWLEQWRDLATG